MANFMTPGSVLRDLERPLDEFPHRLSWEDLNQLDRGRYEKRAADVLNLAHQILAQFGPTRPEFAVTQREPGRVYPVMLDIAAEIQRRRLEGHVVAGKSLEAANAWLVGNKDGIDRTALVEAAAGLVEIIALWDHARELEVQ